MQPSTAEKNKMAQQGDSPELNPATVTTPPDLSPAEIEERSFDLYRLFQISKVRESAHPQFDGMGYSLYNETNEKADISYLAPKKNKGDSRITTGITHEKDSSLVSFFLNMKFEGSVKVYYKNTEQYELGDALTKLVRKSREQEFYDDKRPRFYRNIVAQGTAFLVEEYIEEWIPDKVINTEEINTARLDEVTWIDKGLKLVNSGCVSSMIDGKKVFLEDIREPDIQKQPGVYLVDYIPRQRMQAIWGKNPRWKNVPFMVTPTATALGTLSQGSIYSDWIYGEIDFSKVERIRVYRPYEQRFQTYINGVPMLPAKFPIKAISPSGLIPIAKGDMDLMNLFAYSKSEPAKTKIDQAVFDEILQNMIIKFRQSVSVPRVNNTDKLLTPDMFLGGRLISNIDADKVKPLIENPGVTQADFSFYNLLKEQIDNKTISALLEGNYTGGQITLGQYLDQQKKQMLKLGGKIDGIVNWEKQMLRLRVMDLLYHGYTMDEEGGYKDITLKDSLSDGTKGLNILKFTNDTQSISPDQVFQEELDYQDQFGQAAEISYLNPTLMRQVLNDPNYYICYEVVPVDKNNDKLTQLMFVQMIQQAAALFGIDSLQVDNLKKRYASVMGEQFDDLFLSPEDLRAKQQMAAAEAMAAEQAGGGKKPGAPVASPISSPSVAETMFQ